MVGNCIILLLLLELSAKLSILRVCGGCLKMYLYLRALQIQQ